MREIAKGVDARRSMFQVAEWMDGSDDNIRRRWPARWDPVRRRVQWTV